MDFTVDLLELKTFKIFHSSLEWFQFQVCQLRTHSKDAELSYRTRYHDKTWKIRSIFLRSASILLTDEQTARSVISDILRLSSSCE